MDIRKVKKLIELLQETGVGEIEIHEGEESVRISRFGVTQPAMVENKHPATVSVPATTEVKEETSKAKTIEGHAVKSPMEGTVYLAAAPGEEPFVDIGKRVNEGDTLCVIEAMKMFNQIEADKSGVVSARLIENGNPVEYDQPLFIIE